MSRLFDRWRLRRELSNQMESRWLREYFERVHGVSVGQYSYGCFDPVRVPRGTRIGRYCSFSQTCRLLNANHMLEYISLHPYLYNPTLGVVTREPFERTRFEIEDDVWIGHNATVTAAVRYIGRGAAIAAGAVVTHDVAPYEVVAGVPAKRLRMRFDAQSIRGIEASQWWRMSKSELADLVRKNSDMLFEPARHFMSGKRSA